MSRQTSARRRSALPPLSVRLGEIRVDVSVEKEEDLRSLASGLALVRKRVIADDEAGEALDNFWSATNRCLAAHLCLAEVYLNASAPQYGKDERRAAAAIVAFLEGIVKTQSKRELVLTAQLVEVLQHMQSANLVQHATALVNLADQLPELHELALQVYAANADATLSTGKGAVDSHSVSRLVERVIFEARKCRKDNTSLREQLHLEQEMRACFASNLQEESEKRSAAEATVYENTHVVDFLRNDNGRLAHRINELEAKLQKREEQLESCMKELQRRSREPQQYCSYGQEENYRMPNPSPMQGHNTGFLSARPTSSRGPSQERRASPGFFRSAATGVLSQANRDLNAEREHRKDYILH